MNPISKKKTQSFTYSNTFAYSNAKEAYDYENGFYLTSHPYRLAKALAQYELFKQTLEVPGDIVECGVFFGASFMRLAKFRNILLNQHTKRLIGFDTFGKFPSTAVPEDQKTIQSLFDRCGDESISVEELTQQLEKLRLNEGVQLVKGNVLDTIPQFLKDNPHQKISLMNIDMDFYEPIKTALEHFYDRISPGGIIVLDDYGSFKGANDAIDEFLSKKKEKIRKLPFAMTPSYIIKE